MLEKTSGNFLEEISKSVLSENMKLFCEKERNSRDKKLMKKLAKDLVNNIFENIGYNFEFRPTPIDELIKILSINEEFEENTLRETELYEVENGYTVIHRNGTSKERRRFSLCHEIAHILLGYVTEDLTNLPKDNIEKFCNMIAAELLVPSRLFEIHVLDEILPSISNLHKETGRSDAKLRIRSELPQLNFSIFEAMRKYLQVSRFLLVQQLNWTNFLNGCKSGIIVSWESVSISTGRTPALRVRYTALPLWCFIPMNTRIKNIGLFSAPTIFNSIDYLDVKKWRETIEVKEKRSGKWLQESCFLPSYGEHVVLPSSKDKKYLFTTLSLEK